MTSADLRNAADRWQATAIRILIGEATDDSISATTNSVVDAGAGDDAVTVGEKSFVDGGAGDDKIGAWSDSVIYGGEGNDEIDAWSGSEIDGGGMHHGAASVLLPCLQRGKDATPALEQRRSAPSPSTPAWRRRSPLFVR